jgi:hypothetical protein
MKASAKALFDRNYQSHLKHLKLKGLQPKTIDAYSRAIRRIGERFNYRIVSSQPESGEGGRPMKVWRSTSNILSQV